MKFLFGSVHFVRKFKYILCFSDLMSPTVSMPADSELISISLIRIVRQCSFDC